MINWILKTETPPSPQDSNCLGSVLVEIDGQEELMHWEDARENAKVEKWARLKLMEDRQ